MMNPYQILGIIACCTVFFAGVVALLVMQGIHILLAFLGVYLLPVFLMLGIQPRAEKASTSWKTSMYAVINAIPRCVERVRENVINGGYIPLIRKNPEV